MDSLCLRERLASAKNGNRLGIHSFHRFFGKLIPAIPASAVELFTAPGDLVFDPFCGSGTTLVEAVVRGRDAVGTDINPLAVLISRVKTTRCDPEALRLAAKRALGAGRAILEDGLPEPPYCINIHHWYRPGAIRELAALHAAVDEEPDERARDFLAAVLSAVNRNVSNADPQHVFPGYSKRLRRLDAERGRIIDVFSTFARGVDKRISYLEGLNGKLNNGARADVLLASADEPPPLGRPVDLIVTNPPYVSSVRYLETLKLEMSWAGFISGPEEYRELDRRQFGSERFGVDETRRFLSSGDDRVDAVARRLHGGGHAKMGRTVSLFFRRMRRAVESWDRLLRPGGRMVLKLSPSRVRGEVVPTHEIVADMLRRSGYRVEEEFEDAYNPHSRSLLTSRNYYSGRLDSDRILVAGKP